MDLTEIERDGIRKAISTIKERTEQLTNRGDHYVLISSGHYCCLLTELISLLEYAEDPYKYTGFHPHEAYIARLVTQNAVVIAGIIMEANELDRRIWVR